MAHMDTYKVCLIIEIFEYLKRLKEFKEIKREE